MNIKMAVNGVEQVTQLMVGLKQRTDAGVGSVVLEAGRLFAKSARKRLPKAKRISAQDANEARRLSDANPITLRIDMEGKRAIVGLSPVYIMARDRSGNLLPEVTRNLGAEEYTRTTLLLRRRRGRKSVGGLRSSLVAGGGDRQPPKRFAITGWLERWASDPQKGQQKFRHVLYLRQPRALDTISFAPTWAETEPIIMDLFRRETGEAFGA